jgi:glyoxylase-like metal-dependent hydrolase (beta-lactamase superfamily II)
MANLHASGHRDLPCGHGAFNSNEDVTVPLGAGSRRYAAPMTLPLPSARNARVDIIQVGSLTLTGGGVASSCTLVREGEHVIVVDPGFATSAAAILEPMAALGVQPEDVTEVILSHHHPDHTLHAGHFPNAAVHDHWAIYRGTDWEDSDCDGRVISPSVRLARTPGHTAQDLATLIGTPEGIVVCTHSWFTGDSPIEDEEPEDADRLRASRNAILEVADRIIPGHGPAFQPAADILRT